MTRRVVIVGHPRRPEALTVAGDLVRGLEREGIEVTGSVEELSAFDLLGRPNVATRLHDRLLDDAPELVCVLGGDGTILRAAELVRDTQVPLLGINLGHVGFLAEAEPEDIQHIVTGIAQRSWVVEERQTLEVTASVDGRQVHSDWALNEASVEKAARERMLEVVVEVDGRPLSTYGCDGVVMATPTGSTAYAFSAGGPVVWPDVEALLLVPISAHALFARPMVLGPQARLAVELPGASSAGVIWCDGRRPFDLPPGARVEAWRSDSVVRLARLTTAPFTDRLVAKFDLSVEGWRGRSR